MDLIEKLIEDAKKDRKKIVLAEVRKEKKHGFNWKVNWGC